MSGYIPAKLKIMREEDSKLNVIVVGAGLGGLGAAISILLAGHDVLVLESASEIAEVSLPSPSSLAYFIAWPRWEQESRYYQIAAVSYNHGECVPPSHFTLQDPSK